MDQKNPSDGWVDMPDDGWVDMPAKADQPSLVRRALSSFTQPFDAHKPALEQNQQLLEGKGLVKQDSPDWLAGLGTAVHAFPGIGREPWSKESEARLARFAQENPKTALALRFGAGMVNPVPGGAPRSALPGAVKAATPPAAEAAAPALAEAAAPAAGQFNPWLGAMPQASPNAFEASARAAKVSALAKAVEANATAHLGSDAVRSPQFADTIANMPGEWWAGMAKVAKVNAPSPTTVGEVASFFRDRAAQTAQAVQAAAPQAAQSVLPNATAAAKGPVASMLERAGEKLSSLPRKELDLFDLLTAGHYGVPKAAALKILRNYGPQVAGAVLKKASQLPGSIAGIEAANAVRGATETR